MQISKSFLIACAAAYGAAVSPLCAEDTEAQIRARAALQQKLNELQMQPQPAAISAPAAAPAARAVPSAPAAVAAAPAAADPDSVAKAREAVRQKMAELEQTPAAQPAAAPAAAPAKRGTKPPRTEKQTEHALAQPVAAPAAPGKSTSAQAAPSLPQIEGPAAAIATSKQQRLDELLNRYRADQITPEEYHQQRAAILAEP